MKAPSRLLVDEPQPSEHPPWLYKTGALELAHCFPASPTGAPDGYRRIASVDPVGVRERLAKPPPIVWKQPAFGGIDRQQEQLSREGKIACAEAAARIFAPRIYARSW